ncbi:carbohydrate ABC transporter permease [Paenibacillus mendelii]|uniref:Carbohydrate ABC transporter permease n=1 Tax=Paenibacillus mendelii TaxID=206163 RepID=A0ABV6J785_9BACL|nr:sugar ABC transporter permease [Paenibacillus mendelii]MCQ6564039.1 sugar ABC transporter permease [Paenibacillus mendelii]
MNLAKREHWLGCFSVLPAFVLLAIFMGYPIFNTFYHSFTNWDGLNADWIGLENYRDIFTDGQIWKLLRNNLIFLISIPGILFISLIVTVLLYEEVAGWKFFRSVYYLPTILSAVVVGFLMKTIFSQGGNFNVLLRSLGLESLIVDWLNVVPTAFMVLIFCFYWQTLGQGTLIFLSGMSTITTDMFEAARIDGAGWWQRLWRITIPSLVPTIFYFTITNVIFVFVGLFGLIYSVTGGGPGYETTPIDYMIYLKAFTTGEFGFASALSVVLFAIVIVISWIQLRLSDKWSE